MIRRLFDDMLALDALRGAALPGTAKNDDVQFSQLRARQAFPLASESHGCSFYGRTFYTCRFYTCRFYTCRFYTCRSACQGIRSKRGLVSIVTSCVVGD